MNRDQLTTAAAAHLLGVSDSRVRRLALDGRLNGKKPGRDWVFPREAIEEYGRTRRPGRPRKEVNQ